MRRFSLTSDTIENLRLGYSNFGRKILSKDLLPLRSLDITFFGVEI